MVTYRHIVMTILHLVNNAYNPVSGRKLSDTQTKLDSIKSLIYSNAKATVTLDSTALKELVKLSTSGSSKPTPNVSFSVYVGAKTLTVGQGHTIKYDGILTNDGNGYDDRTGVFVCPVAGTYMFVVDTFTVESCLAIKVNKQIIARAYRGYYPNKPWGQTSRTVIVKLKRGDHVKVDNIIANGETIQIQSDAYSGFTGTLLY
ncbi:complement C1q-like protein 2 [Saccostrea echinata]|uniref:complement C1q-like protein 2 n=1 Tax=Saccostrea echinata TaxID=191078 RepID=UPI002A8343DC|nr:complement C1q-like protein 2 [Saccostrea echinata]